MKRKLAVLGASLALLALFVGRIPSAVQAADPFSDTITVNYTACTAGAGCNADGNIDAGEPVSTQILTALPSNGGSFYDAVQTVIGGVAATNAEPAGTVVGLGSFTIHVNVGPNPTTCSGASSPISPSYNIYATADAGNLADPGYPSGYAKGLTPAQQTLWTTNGGPTGGWIQDFDDDDNDNLPSSIDSNDNASGGDAVPQTVAPQGGAIAGAFAEPLYLPILDALVGETHTTRYIGNAIVALGVSEVPVDFVSYANIPSAGLTTQFAVIGEGSGLGLLPASSAGSGTQTCGPFTSSIAINGMTGGTINQTATGNGSWQFQLSTAADWDGDGVAGYQDNCDAVANTTQVDTDNDGMGDACDPAPGTASAADADSDGFANYVDSCPSVKSIIDSDSDGVSNECDPAPAVVGDGNGYADGYSDHDVIETINYTLPIATGALPAATQTIFTDSNDNHTADSAETALGCALPVGSGIAPCDSDGDGTPDSADADALDANTNGDRLTKCGNDCTFTVSSTTPPTANNMVGDGCDDVDEAGLAGFPGSGFDQWMFYNTPGNLTKLPAPVPANNSAYRSTGNLSVTMAQAVFAYFKSGGGKLGKLEYDQDLNKNNVMDGVEFDRTIVPGFNYAGPPDGNIASSDAQKAFSQFKLALKCGSHTGYQMRDNTTP